MMNILLWIVFGGVAGWLASIIMGKNRSMGLVANVVVGLIGSVIGGWIASLVGIGSVKDFSLPGLGIAVLGAIVLLWLVRFLKGR